MLKYGLSCTESTWNKSCTAFYNWVHGINDTHTSLKQSERPWLLSIGRIGFFYWPALYHSYLMVVALCILEYCNHVVYVVFAFGNYALNGVASFKNERHHNLVGLEVFIYFTQPASGLYTVTYLGKWLKSPKLFAVQWVGILPTTEEYTLHLVEVILKTIVVF